MGWIKDSMKTEARYQRGDVRKSVLQPRIHPIPVLRKPWFGKNRGKIVCNEGWSVAISGSSWRIDRYDYYENGHHLILGGESGSGTIDIIVDPVLNWDEPQNIPLDDATRKRVLNNLTAALQWSGYNVSFFMS